MKFKLILINIIILAIFFLIVDYGILLNRCFQYKPLINRNNGKYCLDGFCIKNNKYLMPLVPFQDSFNYEMLDKKRNITDFYNKQTKKTQGGILLFGGSFMHGESIKYEETFGYTIAKLTKREVYNRAMSSCGFAEMLFQSQLFLVLKSLINSNEKNNINNIIDSLKFNDKTSKCLEKIFKDEFSYNTIYNINKELIDKAEIDYVIYIFIQDHFRRLHSDLFNAGESYLKIRYTYDNGEITLNDTFYTRNKFPAILDFIKEYIISNGIKEDSEFEIFRHFLMETRSNLEKVFYKKPFKFIVIYYNSSVFDPVQEKKWEILKNDGFYVEKISDLVDENIDEKKYLANDNIHPSKEVWEEAIPKLIKKYNLN